MKTLLVVLAVSALLLLGGAVAFGPKVLAWAKTLRPESVATEVRAEPVEIGRLVETVSAPGEIEPYANVDISAQVVGEILALPFRVGDEVKKGDLVVKLDDRDLQAALVGAKAGLESAEANLAATRAGREQAANRLQEQIDRRKGIVTSLEFARRTLQRQQELFDSGDVAEATLDEAMERVRDLEAQLDAYAGIISAAENALVAADAQILQAEAAVKQARADISRAEELIRNTTIYSPIDGRVTALNAEVGETVITGTMNNPGTVIMTIADLSRMRMRARVAEADVPRVRIGQPAKVYIIGYPDEVFDGEVTLIALQRTTQADGTGFFETEIDLRLDGRTLKSGHTANVDIEIATHEGLVVPSQAVVDRLIDDLPEDVRHHDLLQDSTKKTARVVYRVQDEKAIATPVRVGPSDLTHTLIETGLASGDLVVTGPYKALDALKHDDRVRQLGEQPPAPADATPDAAPAPAAEETESARDGDDLAYHAPASSRTPAHAA